MAESIGEHFSSGADSARETAEELRDSAAAKARQARDTAGEKLDAGIQGAKETGSNLSRRRSCFAKYYLNF